MQEKWFSSAKFMWHARYLQKTDVLHHYILLLYTHVVFPMGYLAIS